MSNTAVVMITCKRFEQVWDPFFILFRRYWPDCPYNLYMITDFGSHPDAQNIIIGKDLGFSNNLRYGLEQIPEETVIYFQEDYLATDKFDTKRIEKFVKYVKDYNLGCLRLTPCPGPTIPWDIDHNLGILQKGEAYRISTQTAIWSKDFIISILAADETGGEFEIKGTKRSVASDRLLLSVWRDQTPTPYFITAVVRNKWEDGALELLEKENISTENITRIIK